MARTGPSLVSAPLIVGVLLLAAPWIAVAALAPGNDEVRFDLDHTEFRNDEGAEWVAPVRIRSALSFPFSAIYEFPTDHGSNTLSGLRLFEDDRELGPSRSVHSEIRTLGSGRFSHWGRDVRFSTSDNSDPRSNGRTYSVRTPLVMSRSIVLVSILLSLAGLAIALASPGVRPSLRRWGDRWVSPSQTASTIASWPAVPLPRAAWALLVAAWIACAVTAVISAGSDRDPYLLSTVPTAGYSDHRNSLVGYAQIVDGAPTHAENSQTWDHLAMFHGAIIAADMYANRPLYPFLVSIAAWALGPWNAALVVNLLAWALGAWAAVRIGAELARRPSAGVVAGLLACVGPGWWFHIGDYSAHLLSFSTSSLALLVLLRSRVWAVRQPAEIHAAIGAVLVLASLAYNSGLFFTAAYVLLAIRRNRWWHVALAAAIGVFVQRLWPPLLNLLALGNYDYYAVERQLFDNAMREWSAMLREGALPGVIVDRLLDTLVSFLPAVPLLLGGTLALLLGGMRKPGRDEPSAPEGGAMLLQFLAIALPIAALIVYSPTATARGYLVFGAAAAVWAIAGWMFSRLKPGAWSGIGAGLLLLGLLVQVVLDTRHAGGDARAVKLFMWGMPKWSNDDLEHLRHSIQTVVVGLHGEPTPTIAGGDATLIECGALGGGEPVPMLRAFKNGNQFGQMLILRAVLALPCLAALHLLRVAGLWRWPRGPALDRWWRAAPVLAMSLLAIVLLLPPLAVRLHRGGPVIHRAS
ncbi:MAG: hypothetical protein FJ253_09700, partial [Phycisphaerae bacterium]|nr:hypothetical protein [Phycisphaerae bacterium]